MPKVTRQALDQSTRRGRNGAKILRIVQIGSGTAPQREEDVPRYNAAREIAVLYTSMVGKSLPKIYVMFNRIHSVLLPRFVAAYPLEDISEA